MKISLFHLHSWKMAFLSLQFQVISHFLTAYWSCWSMPYSFLCCSSELAVSQCKYCSTVGTLSSLPGCGLFFFVTSASEVSLWCLQAEFLFMLHGFAGFTESKDCCLQQRWKILSLVSLLLLLLPSSACPLFLAFWLDDWIDVDLLSLPPMPFNLTFQFFLSVLHSGYFLHNYIFSFLMFPSDGLDLLLNVLVNFLVEFLCFSLQEYQILSQSWIFPQCLAPYWYFQISLIFKNV